MNDFTHTGTIAVHGTCTNMPPDIPSSNWGLLAVSSNTEDDGTACTQRLSIMVIENQEPLLYERNWNGINWSKWARLGTATPPQEFDLPLAEGFANGGGGNSIYWKDQFNQVHFCICVSTPQISVTAGVVVATLPEVFRPRKTLIYDCASLEGSTRRSGSFNVKTDGTISYFGDILSAGALVFGSGVFVAAS